MAIVLLRITVGWHFFYEGVWKTNPDNKFSAIPFLGLAKGPAKTLFYDMLPDIDGKTRLKIQEHAEVTKLNDPKSKAKNVKYFPTFEEEWVNYYLKFKNYYTLSEEQDKQAKRLLHRYLWSSYDYAAEISTEVEGYSASYDRYIASVAEGANQAEHQRKRDWDQMLKLRGEVDKWASTLTGYGDDFQMQLWNLLDAKQQNKGQLSPIAYGNNKLIVKASFVGVNSWVDFLNFGVTWGLTAIGLFLIMGLCSRLAALGGAAFLCAVLLTQPPWPSIYPHVHPEVGHAMIVDKNFVELVACLVIASMPVGRWAGLDFFLWHKFGGKKLWDRYAGRFCKKSECQCCCKSEGKPKA